MADDLSVLPDSVREAAIDFDDMFAHLPNDENAYESQWSTIRAELLRLTRANMGWHEQHARDSRALRVLRDEMDTLQRRIDSAPVVVYGKDCDCASPSGGMHEDMIGKLVALVVTEEGGK